MSAEKVIPFKKKLFGPSGEVLVTATEQAEKQDKLQAMQSLRDRLDTMCALAAEEGREEDAAALDAGSFALTYVIHQAQQQ